MADVGAWQCLDEESLSPLERLLPNDVYQALQEEIKRQRSAAPPASGLGNDHLNTIPANYEDALKKATILMDRTLRWRRLCCLYAIVERQARQRCLTLAKRNQELEHRHQADLQNIRRLQIRLKSLLKIPATPPKEETDPGPRPATHFAQLRTRLGVTYRKLAVYATGLLGIPMTASGALGILNRMADRLAPIYHGSAHALTVQPTLHGDETGWKMDRQRWQMWFPQSSTLPHSLCPRCP